MTWKQMALEAYLASNLLLLLLIRGPLLRELLCLGAHILGVVALVGGGLAELRLHYLCAELVQKFPIVRHNDQGDVLLLQISCTRGAQKSEDCQRKRARHSTTELAGRQRHRRHIRGLLPSAQLAPCQHPFYLLQSADDRVCCQLLLHY